MLSFENWKIKLAYTGFGGLLGCLFTIMGMFAPQVTAQHNKFGYIECTRLKVVDGEGKMKVFVGIEEDNGFIGVYGNDGKSEVSISIAEHGGVVTALGEDGKSKAVLGIDKEGGYVLVTGRSKGEVFMGLNRMGGGYIVTKNKDGYRQ